MKRDNTELMNVKVGISHGDINGVGYEIIIKSLEDKRILELMTPIVYGISKAASYHRKTVKSAEINFNLAKSVNNISIKKANLIDIYRKEVKIELGKSTRIAGEMSLISLESATEALINKEIDVLVTAPINKYNIQSGEFHFPGHTEYLADKFGSEDYLMLMVSDQIRIGAITGHIALKDVASCLNKELIIKKIKILNNSLINDFAIRKPKIAILSLNPHAGDNGLIGKEEEEIISPAIREAYDQDILVYGPYSADGFFASNDCKKFDGVLGMYHDQTMIPFKILSFENGVNYTAGLPFVRTSPAHGTAYNIAGKDKASPDSFRSAMYLAVQIYKNREMQKKLLNNPLQIDQSKNEIRQLNRNGNGFVKNDEK